MPRHKRHKHQISILVPFNPGNPHHHRQRVWTWLKQYWGHELHGEEIVMGHNHDKPFSKTKAINDAARKAKGDIFVILDSDTYISGSVIRQCATRIRTARNLGFPLWFIPYRHIYRLTKGATLEVLDSDPKHPLRFTSPPPPECVGGTEGSMHGHRFGALIQIMPREAFEAVGGMDERFCGWGGEDIAFVRALDTLWSSHKTTDNDVLHMWHHHIGHTHMTRMWEGQINPRVNERLANRYNLATGDRQRMYLLVDEDDKYVPKPNWLVQAWNWIKNKVFAVYMKFHGAV